MMRTLTALAASLLLAGTLGAASQLAPGVFHLHNHPDGGWQGPSADGTRADIGYGMILTDTIDKDGAVPDADGRVDEWLHVIFDFEDPASTMKLQFKGSDMSVRIWGTARAWGTDNGQSNLQYHDLGLATIDVTTYGGRYETDADAGAFYNYADVVFQGAGVSASGTVTMEAFVANRVTRLAGMRRGDGLMHQVGDFNFESTPQGPGHRLDAHPDFKADFSGMFTKSEAASPGSADQPRGPRSDFASPAPDRDDVATETMWVGEDGDGDTEPDGEPDDDDDGKMAKPGDFISVMQPRGRAPETSTDN